MKKFKDKLGKGTSHASLIDWTKHDDKMLEYTINGDENKLRIALLRKGVSSLKKKSDGKTLLDVACEQGHVDCLGVLLEKCADVISVSKSGSLALHTAAKSGHSDCILKLLEYKVKVDCQDADKMTALHHAASKGHAACVKILISNGARLNIRDKDGRTPLLIAIQAAREPIVRLLLENGAKVNLTDSAHKTPLMYASLIGLKDAVSILLQHGANPLMRDTNGHQAQDFARISGYGDIVSIISTTPVLPNWSYAQEYEDDDDSPSQEDSTVGSNDGSDVLSLVSHQDSDHGVGSVYSSDRRSSMHSVSTSVSSPSNPAAKYELTLGGVQVGENGIHRGKMSHNPDVSVDSADEKQKLVEYLQNEVHALQLENERLRNENNDINVDESVPTIPITVYQQLKASTAEQLLTLNVKFTNMKKENENLKHQLSEAKLQTQDEMLAKAEQKINALEEQVQRLQKQLLEADSEYSRTINVYRLHLLNAVQGDMNTTVRKALELILKMRYDEQFC